SSRARAGSGSARSGNTARAAARAWPDAQRTIRLRSSIIATTVAQWNRRPVESPAGWRRGPPASADDAEAGGDLGGEQGVDGHRAGMYRGGAGRGAALA